MRQIDFEHGGIAQNILKAALPMLVAQVLNLLYNIVDRIYIARIPDIGTAALGAVGLCFPIIVIITAFSNLFGSGGAPLFAIARGSGDKARAGLILNLACTLLLCCAGVLMVIGLLFARPILVLFGASPEALQYALPYLMLYLLGTYPSMLTTGLNPFINAQGYATAGMLSVVIGAAANLVLDPVFIFVFGMGVKGAALATILSQACSAWWVLHFLTSRKATLRIERRYMRPDRRIIGATLALGVSPFIMASTESLVGFVLNSSLKNFGDIYVSALAILQSAMQFASVPLTGFAQGFVPIISYNYGHGDKQRVKDCFRIVLIVMFSFNLILMLFMILFPSTVASAFTSDEELIDTVRWVMPIFLAGMTIFGLQRACQNMFVALGQAKISIFIALLRKVILLIPLALLLPHFMGVTGVYAAEAVSDATAAICCTLLFIWKFPKILGKIKKKEERAAQ